MKRNLWVWIPIGLATSIWACGGGSSATSPVDDAGGSDATRTGTPGVDGSSDDAASEPADAGPYLDAQAPDGRTFPPPGDGGACPIIVDFDAGPDADLAFDAAYARIPPGVGRDYCDAMYGAIDDRLQRCCTAADKASFNYLLAAQFVEVFRLVCGAETTSSIACGRATGNEANVRACAAYFQAALGQACDSAGDPDAGGAASCFHAIVGLGAAGAPCWASHQCRDGLTCVGTVDATSEGRCSVPPAVGADCGSAKTADGGGGDTTDLVRGNHPACATGARCDASSGKCVTRSGDGTSCVSDDECLEGHFCHLGKCGTTGPSDVNGPCAAESDCTRSSAYCAMPADGGVSALGSCAPKKTAGTPCRGEQGECFGNCTTPDDGGASVCASFCGSK